jgi:uncharacterized membrane protein YfhO
MPGSTIELTGYQPNALTYAVNAAQAGLVVFSEVYYADGWQAYLNGQPVDHIRVNYILRAMEVPAGKHTIEFKFEPSSYSMGNTVSWISSILLLVVLGGAVFYGMRRKPEEVEKEVIV